MNRIQYIDSLKGLAILLIVIVHVFLFGIQHEGILSRFISLFHVPLFFFISGYLALKDEYRNYSSLIVKKFRRIFIPFVSSILLLAAFKGPVTLSDSFDGFYWGMWFLLVLFEIFLVFYTGIFLFQSTKFSSKFSQLIYWTLIVSLLYGIGLTVNRHFRFVSEVLNIERVSLYFPYFILGYAVRYMKWEKILQHRLTQSVLMTLWFAGFYFIYNFESSSNFIVFTLVRISAILTLFGIFANAAESSNIHKLSIAGEYSLEIYILHYYLLFSLPRVALYLSSSGTFWTSENLICGSVLSVIISIFVVFLSIVIARFLRHNILFAGLLFGDRNGISLWKNNKS